MGDPNETLETREELGELVRTTRYSATDALRIDTSPSGRIVIDKVCPQCHRIHAGKVGDGSACAVLSRRIEHD